MRKKYKLIITGLSSDYVSEQDDLIYKRFGNADTTEGLIHNTVNVWRLVPHNIVLSELYTIFFYAKYDIIGSKRMVWGEMNGCESIQNHVTLELI